MKRLTRNFAVGFLALGLAATVLAGESVKVKLNDGSRWRGELSDAVTVTMVENGIEKSFTGVLTKVKDIYVVVKIAVGSQTMDKLIPISSIVSIEDAAGDAAKAVEIVTADLSSGSKPGAASTSPSIAGELDNTPGVFLLPLEGMVGTRFRHEEIVAIGKEADKYGDGQIIVFVIESGGGMMSEMEKIHDTMMELKKRHRLVAWVKEAISAACATAIHCDEIYFMTEGTAGSMTGYAGTTSLQGEQRLAWERTAWEWMEAGGRFGHIGRVMIHAPYELSYDIHPVTGDQIWYEDLSGEFILSRAGQNLTFNSSNALHSGFADAVVDTEEELAVELDLKKWREKSTLGRKMAKKWLETCDKAEVEIPRLIANINRGEGAPAGVEAMLGKRIKLLKQAIGWWNRCPNIAMMHLPPKRTLEDQIEAIRYQLAQIRRNR